MFSRWQHPLLLQGSHFSKLHQILQLPQTQYEFDRLVFTQPALWKLLNVQGDPKKMIHSVLQLRSFVGVQSYFFRGVSESEFRARRNKPLYRYPLRILNGSKLRARGHSFFIFLNTSKKIVSGAANFSNFSLRFLKRSCSTKSTRCELNQCFGISVTAMPMIMCCPRTPFLSESFHSVIWQWQFGHFWAWMVSARTRFWAI